jgi:hypothetical protein
MSVDIQKFVDNFLSIVAKKDHGALDDLIADEVTLHTPRFFKPITDRMHFKAVLLGFTSLVEDLNYSEQRHWINGREVVFEFRGKLGKIELHGVDIITLNDQGQIETLSVMIRPMSALVALGEREDKFVLDLLKKQKSQ